ncbi:hypothetical protein Sez_1408 [Streptococcus equi subsp. zooepidemicus MGCS10565]|uniref:Uncharacterized protein n=1 Tax=Streptococcus equi subsp. zooepidemicus (strain MGCS10565) TaxID=552526 RepID=B4U427_STREM|nr:hypothetical protein Sez_1408 [Streptococcus equi subsp. zooepidemicus MGCS10565]
MSWSFHDLGLADITKISHLMTAKAGLKSIFEMSIGVEEALP